MLTKPLIKGPLLADISMSGMNVLHTKFRHWFKNLAQVSLSAPSPILLLLPAKRQASRQSPKLFKL